MPVVPKIKLAGNLASILPPALCSLKRWTAWSLIEAKVPGKKPSKKPLSLTNDASTWHDLPTAVQRAEKHAGVGFQMLGVTSIVGIDIDNCINPAGQYNPIATSLLAALPDTYAEVTPSGTGLRLFASRPDEMDVPEFLSRDAGVECYRGLSARYLTVTGAALPGRAGKYSPLTEAALRLLAPLAAAPGGGALDLEIQLAVPEIPRTEDWPQVFDTRRGRIGKDLTRYLTQGDIPGARSEKSFAVACKMLGLMYTPQEVFIVLHSAPGSWEAALDKRDQDPTRARELIWADIGRAQKIVRAEAAAVEGRTDEWTALGLHTEIQQKELRVVQSQSNLLRVLTGHSAWTGRLALDITTGLLLLDATPLDDSRFFDLQEKVSKFCGWRPGQNRQWWTDALRALATQNPINPRAAWLRSLAWDGTQRLDTWVNDHLAAEPGSLNAVIGRKWLLSLVARWMDPGCKVDTVFVLVGKEGTRKTTFFEVMAGGPERVAPLQGFERDDRMTAAQAWIVEMPEAALFRRADQNRLKSFITEATDQYRPPYAAAPVNVKRGFVLVSTSNDLELFQPGQDGLRRFWPIFVRDNHIDLAWIRAHREQLLAEAVLAYDLGEEWWFTETPAELKRRQLDAVMDTPVDDALSQLVARQAGKGGMGLSDLMSEVGAILGYRPNDRLVSALLPRHGIVKKRTSTSRYWLHPSWENEGTNVIEMKKKA